MSADDDLDRTGHRLRRALHDAADEVEPGERLDAILRRAHEPALYGVPVEPSPRRSRYSVVAAAAAALVVAAGVAGAVEHLPRAAVPGNLAVRTPGPLATAPTWPANPTGPVLPSGAGPSATTMPIQEPTDVGQALPVYYVARESGAGSARVLAREFFRTDAPPGDSIEALTKRTGLAFAVTNLLSLGEGALSRPTGSGEGGSVNGVALTGDGITVTVTGPTPALPTETERRALLAAWVYTAQAAVGRGDLPVRFVVTDGAKTLFGSLPVSSSWRRADLGVRLAAIWVDVPGRGQALPPGRPVTVKGIASVFEGALAWRVTTGAGAVVASGTTTAASGAPERAAYAFTVPALPVGAYTVAVTAAGAKDGALVAQRSMDFTVG